MFHIIASIFFYDVWFYASHILLHKYYLYPLHAIHHRNFIPTFLDTYEGHFLEGPFQSLGLFVPFTVYTYTVTDAIIILAILNIRGMMRHDERFIPLIGNHHLLHHKYPAYNFGEYWLDTLFGTKYPNKAEYTYGLVYI